MVGAVEVDPAVEEVPGKCVEAIVVEYEAFEVAARVVGL